MIKLKLNNEFSRNVLILITGTSIAQAIPIAIMPILTRLYTPQEFGIFALYVAIASLFAVLATARYELAIMLPKTDLEAINLVVLSLIASVMISLLSMALIFYFNGYITHLLGNPEISAWLYCIPATVLFTGLYQSLNYWTTRKKKFKRLAVSRTIQGSATASIQLGAGYGFGGAAGLILGYILGQGIAAAIFARMVVHDDAALLKQASEKEVIHNLKTYRKFPLLSTSGALLDNAALQMPIFILTRFFSSQMVGLFNITFRALNLPMVLIAAAISQVLFQKISSMHNEQPELLFAYIVKLFLMLVTATVPFMVIMLCWGEPLFAYVFGAAWSEAGTFAGLLSIAVAIRFAVSPLSTVLALEHNIKLGLYWQLTYFITVSATLLCAARFDIYTLITFFVIHELVLYSFYLVLILIGSKRYKSVTLLQPIN